MVHQIVGGLRERLALALGRKVARDHTVADLRVAVGTLHDTLTRGNGDGIRVWVAEYLPVGWIRKREAAAMKGLQAARGARGCRIRHRCAAGPGRRGRLGQLGDLRFGPIEFPSLIIVVPRRQSSDFSLDGLLAVSRVGMIGEKL